MNCIVQVIGKKHQLRRNDYLTILATSTRIVGDDYKNAKQKMKSFKGVYLLILLLIFATGVEAQSVTNGSINGVSAGTNTFVGVSGWTKCTVFSGWNNTPDVCDINFPSHSPYYTVSPVSSPDGGTWVGLANGVDPIEDECIVGNMTGLVTNSFYSLKFYTACFGTGSEGYANGILSIIQVIIGNDTTLILIPMKASTWLINCIPFKATSSNMIFSIQNIAGGGYASLDGFDVISSSAIINLGNDTTLCQGKTLALGANTINATYLWQDNSTNPTFNVTQEGTYWVEVTKNHCSVIDTIVVNYNQKIDLGNDKALCQGETLILGSTTPNATYLWQDNSTNPTFNVTQEGTYWVEVTENNCIEADTILVNYNSLPTIDLGKDTTLCQGENLTLDATTPNATYLWQDNSTNPTFKVNKKGSYWIKLTVNNCSATDRILIIEEDCELILEMPNLFTPNKDGINDFFVPIHNKGIISMNTTIFNRWGSKIFETSNLFIEWGGQGISDGTYFWIASYIDIHGKENNLKGYVTILR